MWRDVLLDWVDLTNKNRMFEDTDGQFFNNHDDDILTNLNLNAVNPLDAFGKEHRRAHEHHRG